MSKFHCPKCGRYVSNVLAEEYGELQGKDSWYPYFQWGVFGDCKTDGRVEVLDHDGEEGCDCYCVGVWESWFDQELDERLVTAPAKEGGQDV